MRYENVNKSVASSPPGWCPQAVPCFNALGFLCRTRLRQECGDGAGDGARPLAAVRGGGMDRFLVKADPGDPREGGEEPAPTGGASRRLRSPSWRHLRAEGLNCDYTILFGKAEADEIFRELEQEVEYFTGRWRT